MATFDPHRHSRQFLGLYRLVVEDQLSSTELDSPSSGDQSLRSHTGSVWTTDNSSLLEDLFTEGFLPSFNTPLTNPLEPVLAPVVHVLPASVVGTFPSILSTTNGSWHFVDTFSPPPFPQSTVITTPSMANLAIPFVPGTTTHMTPSMRGTQPMSGSTPLVSNCMPSISATYIAPYNAQYGTMGMVPIYQQYGRFPLYSSNPQIHVSGGFPICTCQEGT